MTVRAQAGAWARERKPKTVLKMICQANYHLVAGKIEHRGAGR